MSNIFIYDIVGTGHFVIPESDAGAVATTTDFRTFLATVANLSFTATNCNAWVVDSGNMGVEGERSLGCLISGFTYSGSVCPSESAVDTMIAAIRYKLLNLPLGDWGFITSVGVIEVNIFNAGAVQPA